MTDSPVCARCGKPPSEINEYVEAAHDEGMTPDEYVRENEGTYNRKREQFWCTECYIDIGTPLGKAP